MIAYASKNICTHVAGSLGQITHTFVSHVFVYVKSNIHNKCEKFETL